LSIRRKIKAKWCSIMIFAFERQNQFNALQIEKPYVIIIASCDNEKASLLSDYWFLALALIKLGWSSNIWFRPRCFFLFFLICMIEFLGY
jgi:hypothetical protein